MFIGSSEPNRQKPAGEELEASLRECGKALGLRRSGGSIRKTGHEKQRALKKKIYLANQKICKATPKKSRKPAPEISNSHPTPPSATKMAGGLFAITCTTVFII
ncbi:MAG: hypothetical protein ABH864_02345 [archaeon]